MEKFNVYIIETLQRKVIIEADTREEALRKLKDKYDNEEIVLDYSDLVETEFSTEHSEVVIND